MAFPCVVILWIVDVWVQLILFFESNKQYHIEASENGLLIIGNERFSSVKEMKALAYFGIGLQKII